METYTCETCGNKFTARERDEGGDADTLWERWTDIVEGQYIEWDELRCPKCWAIADESGR